MFATGGEETGGKAAAREIPKGVLCRIRLSVPFLAGDAAMVHPSGGRVCRCQILPHNFRIFHWRAGFRADDVRANSFTRDRYKTAARTKEMAVPSGELGGSQTLPRGKNEMRA